MGSDAERLADIKARKSAIDQARSDAKAQRKKESRERKAARASAEAEWAEASKSLKIIIKELNGELKESRLRLSLRQAEPDKHGDEIDTVDVDFAEKSGLSYGVLRLSVSPSGSVRISRPGGESTAVAARCDEPFWHASMLDFMDAAMPSTGPRPSASRDDGLGS